DRGATQAGGGGERPLRAGAARRRPFSPPPISPRVFNGNIYYAPGNVSVGPCASASPYGLGCYSGSTTVYQAHANLAAFDLGGSSALANVVRLTAVGAAGYRVEHGTAAFFTGTSVPVQDNSLP